MDEFLQRLEKLETQQATEQAAGIARLCSLTDVTQSDGLVLPASEKNPSIEGSLANAIVTKFSALEQWEDFSSSFYVEGGRNTEYEYISLFYNRALQVAVLCFRCGVTGTPRTWRNGEVVYKNNRLKSYGIRIVLTGYVIGTSRALETYELQTTK